MINIFKLFCRNITPNQYLSNLVNSKDGNRYSFDAKYANQEGILLKLFGNARFLNNKIKIIVISDTHNTLGE